MKKYLILFLFPVAGGLYAQTDTRLVSNPKFIKLVDNIANKQLDIRDDLKRQLPQNYAEFCRNLKTCQTDQQVDALVAQYNLSTEYSYDAMSEHLAHQYILIKENPWLETLSPAERRETVLAAYAEGMNSGDQTWVTVKQTLVSRTQIRGTANKTIGQIIVGCVRETINSAFNIFESVAAATYAIERGDFWGTVKAIKNILKKAGSRLGWWGLIAAAWDIGSCIYNEI